jgi:hypothetical protein
MVDVGAPAPFSGGGARSRSAARSASRSSAADSGALDGSLASLAGLPPARAVHVRILRGRSASSERKPRGLEFTRGTVSPVDELGPARVGITVEHVDSDEDSIAGDLADSVSSVLLLPVEWGTDDPPADAACVPRAPLDPRPRTRRAVHACRGRPARTQLGRLSVRLHTFVPARCLFIHPCTHSDPHSRTATCTAEY